MKPSTVFLLCVIAFSHQASAETETLRDLIAQFDKLYQQTCSDASRDEHSELVDIDLSKATPGEIKSSEKMVRKMLTEWKADAKKEFANLTIEQRTAAHKRLKDRKFHVDSGIDGGTVSAIVKYFFDYPSLDPRILSLQFVDSETIKITTGVVRGKLDGEGMFYVARKEEGIWIVRCAGCWIS